MLGHSQSDLHNPAAFRTLIGVTQLKKRPGMTESCAFATTRVVHDSEINHQYSITVVDYHTPILGLSQ